MIRELLQDDHEMLRREMPMWDFDNPAMDIPMLCATLITTMRYHGGIGLAANQVDIEGRVFAMETRSGPVVAFNPLVVWMSHETVRLREGCLSFPRLELTIARPREIELAYHDDTGARLVKSFAGIEARTALHEIDHLDGALFTDRVSRLKLAMAMKKVIKPKKSA